MDDMQFVKNQHDFIHSMASLTIDGQQLAPQELQTYILDNNNTIGMAKDHCCQQPATEGEQTSCSNRQESTEKHTASPSDQVTITTTTTKIVRQEDENCLANQKRTVFAPTLSVQRYNFVLDLLLKHHHIKSVTDLGSGNCRLMPFIKGVTQLTACNFVEINNNILEYEAHYNAQPIPWDLLFGRPHTLQNLTVNLYQGDMTIPDSRLLNSDIITLVEVIEHLHPDVLERVPATVFGVYKPNIVVITTPNSEFNVLFFGNDKSKFRHWDHKFEWTRQEFYSWCHNVVKLYPDYNFEMNGVGHLLPESEPLGPCTQIAIFTRIDKSDTTYPLLAADMIMDSMEPSETGIGQTLKLHSRYVYPGEKVKPPEPDNNPPIDWSTVT